MRKKFRRIYDNTQQRLAQNQGFVVYFADFIKSEMKHEKQRENEYNREKTREIPI